MLPTAWLNLRHSDDARFEAFRAGLNRIGFEVSHHRPDRPGPGDIYVTWNRIHVGDQTALAFSDAGLKVLVAENAAWGNDFAGNRWLTLARDRHNTRGMFHVGDSDRWDCLEVELQPFRSVGETVILGQRGIGSGPTAMPRNWPQDALRRHGGRIRPHPSKREKVPLERDLARAGRVVTWGSGAAIKALMLGIPVISEMPGWIGAQDNTEAGRLAMFRQLAWAQWRIEEIASGEAFSRLLA